ncbi:unnamed protein product [Amoebophrya sp. A120]|nr:unnamed protein product [Amoebophrya sp. A120]|eukprot:GSA120T00024382001.1
MRLLRDTRSPASPRQSFSARDTPPGCFGRLVDGAFDATRRSASFCASKSATTAAPFWSSRSVRGHSGRQRQSGQPPLMRPHSPAESGQREKEWGIRWTKRRKHTTQAYCLYRSAV